MKNWVRNSLRENENWHWKQIKLSNIFSVLLVVCLLLYVAPYGTFPWWPYKCLDVLNKFKRSGLIECRLLRKNLENFFFIAEVNIKKLSKRKKGKFIKKLLLGILSPFPFLHNLLSTSFVTCHCSLLTSLSFHSWSSTTNFFMTNFFFVHDKFFQNARGRKRRSFLLCAINEGANKDTSK